MGAQGNIGFGMIGCGDVTERKSGPAFQKIQGCSLEMVMRRDPRKLEDYARRHGVPRWTTDYRELLDHPAVDAVYIATPPDSHCFYALEAIRRGKPVYVEKPMALSAQEGRRMCAAAKEAGVPLFVAYYRRGQAKFLKARKLLETGAVGGLRSFSYAFACPPLTFDPARPWLMDRSLSGGGLLYDVGSHMIDMLLFLMGAPLEVRGISASLGRQHDAADTHSVTFRFQSGAQGAAQFSFSAAENRDELWISGSEGSLSLSVMSNGPLTLRRPDGTRDFPFAPIEHVEQPFIERVVRSLLGEAGPDATGAGGLLVQELLEAIDGEREWRAGSR